MLAAVPYRDAVVEMPLVLEAAMDELGLSYHLVDSANAMEAGLTALSARMLAGHLAPRDLTTWAHQKFSHDGLALARTLVELDDMYDCAEYPITAPDTSEVEAQIRAEARRIVALSE
ncbi:hypothetical protein [Fodinicola feengrottensis]|nr:hypothetical protein [Fodinicola feengrottensis]